MLPTLVMIAVAVVAKVCNALSSWLLYSALSLRLIIDDAELSHVRPLTYNTSSSHFIFVLHDAELSHAIITGTSLVLLSLQYPSSLQSWLWYNIQPSHVSILVVTTLHNTIPSRPRQNPHHGWPSQWKSSSSCLTSGYSSFRPCPHESPFQSNWSF